MTATYIGRKDELKGLKKLRSKSTASLVCLLGRRRIGKSALIEEFSKGFKKYLSIQGLAPVKESTNQDHLDDFMLSLGKKTNTHQPNVQDWSAAFEALGKICAKGEWLVLLDEISWMGYHDPLFASKLKVAWDSHFKKNPQLILVLCGSVSSWIQANILKNMNFEGRISLEINLLELSLNEIDEFLSSTSQHFGPLEKATIASITGGVPKYLEEIIATESAYENLSRLCFNKHGILYSDFNKIFTEIFQRKSASFERIVRSSLEKKLSPIELAKKTKIDYSGEFLDLLQILELSGFISRDYYFQPQSGGKVSKFSHIRVKDNYLRFYLKVIEPLKPQIEKGGKTKIDFMDLPAYEAILGFQFENLLLFNRALIQKHLSIDDKSLISSAPYVQKKRTTNKGACQVDLLIHSNLDVFYLCEFKCKKVIDASVVKEVKNKMKFIDIPKRSSLKPVLVYVGEIYPSEFEKIKAFFYKIISFEDLLGPSD